MEGMGCELMEYMPSKSSNTFMNGLCDVGESRGVGLLILHVIAFPQRNT